ncbi:MAG: tetratricopeptide repeat protein [Bryobacteraceae bacterium]
MERSVPGSVLASTGRSSFSGAVWRLPYKGPFGCAPGGSRRRSFRTSASRLFERAVKVKPDDPDAWNNLGRALAAQGDLDAAQKAYERQISINPRDPYAYNNLGLLQERQGRWDAAIESFRMQLRVHAGDSGATSNLPRAL